ncbi:hypothetical protein [Alienimonas chondri]|uniref:Uncharacterized protein n=1 Tax=Alienimonas chondri TaxID=2681879 RepID=A0ABX1V8M0_9PLAN|nr:hypothetical protein [Alienimonas chondri]NNJ24464.1 hypothetical protein [Alienimonas chondri]
MPSRTASPRAAAGVFGGGTTIYGGLLDRVEATEIDGLNRRASVPTWRKAAPVVGSLTERFRPAPPHHPLIPPTR